ncbi:MAG TPA: ABC transporter ATP-binding protein, partial [Actinomycetaceae bacterium]|nr:ABC transporter ATP-binding protein [Actinomycetaceae bacterium]
MSHTTAQTQPAGARQPDAVLAFRGLDVNFRTEFGRVHAVKGIDLEVFPGEVVALVGESGSGKSVTSMTALGLLPSNARVGGEVLVGGKDVRKLDDRGLRQLRGKDVAMVFQEPMTALNPVLTIGDQLTESLELHGVAYGTAATRRAVELLTMVGIPEPERRLKQYPHELSGGQRQRIVIAIALSCEPDVIIADEPTTALDVTVQAEILDLLRSLKDKLHTGILLITHNMGVVADMADRVAVMLQGTIVERGSVIEVLNSPQHDYTKRLLAAVPHLGRGPGQHLVVEAEEPEDGEEEVAEEVAEEPDVAAEAPAEPPSPESGASPAEAPSDAPALELRNVVIEYRRVGKAPFTAVDDVSFTINKNEIVGLVGESGSGKSTIGRCVLGLLPASSGEVAVFGEDLGALHRREAKRVRRRIGVIFQDPAASLNPRMPIGEVIAEPMVVHKV